MKRRFGFLLLMWVSLFVLACSLYFQYIGGMHPCPLCLMQRYCVAIISLVAFWGYHRNFAAHSKGSLFLVIFSFLGIYFAGRQLWLQSLPADQMQACLPSLDILLRYFTSKDVLHALLWGSGDCAKVPWYWLGISMAGWSLFYFSCSCLFSILLFLHKPWLQK